MCSSYGLSNITQDVLEYIRPRLDVLGLAEINRHSCKSSRLVDCLLDEKALMGKASIEEFGISIPALG